ncbi:hypothetical protein [Spiroplasma endosymbiont of Clivina fossor]|uniref:hypothetical protein n=1 Tax=Spiroplasma endosymbiont of Clivina fossor TaxID=3066282 RepID=UPI00313DBD9C
MPLKIILVILQKMKKYLLLALKNELKLLIQKKIMRIKNNVLRNYYGIFKTVCSDKKMPAQVAFIAGLIIIITFLFALISIMYLPIKMIFGR